MLDCEQRFYLNSIVDMLFSGEEYCKHGTRGTDGTCQECYDEVFVESKKLAIVIDFPNNSHSNLV